MLVEDYWWRERHPPAVRKKKPGRPVLLSESEVLTLAILAQWPRFRSVRDYFWRFASSHLRSYFPALCSQSQLNRAKTLSGLLARLAAKVAAYTLGQRLNSSLGRPLRHFADLLI